MFSKGNFETNTINLVREPFFLWIVNYVYVYTLIHVCWAN